MPRPRKQPALTASRSEKPSNSAFKPRFALPRLRILPLTIVMALLMFGLKSIEVYQGGREIQLRLQEAYAQKPPPEGGNKRAAQAQQATAEQAGDADAEEKEMQLAKLEEESAEVIAENEAENQSFTQTEIDLLQSLRERRKQLEERSRELDLKEKLLEATELRINDKLSEIKTLEQQVSQLLERYSDQEESHIRSLVKIYENMKPKSAAIIFNELELPILLEVIDEMSERKVAPILASMDPLKAKEVTSDLAELRKLRPLPVRPDGAN